MRPQAIEKASGILSWPFRRLLRQSLSTQYRPRTVFADFPPSTTIPKRTGCIHQALSPDHVMPNVFLIAYGKIYPCTCLPPNFILSFSLSESICHSVSVMDRHRLGFGTRAAHLSLPAFWMGSVLKTAASVSLSDEALLDQKRNVRTPAERLQQTDRPANVFVWDLLKAKPVRSGFSFSFVVVVVGRKDSNLLRPHLLRSWIDCKGRSSSLLGCVMPCKRITLPFQICTTESGLEKKIWHIGTL